jgi:hypothetical protein
MEGEVSGQSGSFVRDSIPGSHRVLPQGATGDVAPHSEDLCELRPSLRILRCSRQALPESGLGPPEMIMGEPTFMLLEPRRGGKAEGIIADVPRQQPTARASPKTRRNRSPGEGKKGEENEGPGCENQNRFLIPS